MIVKVTMKGLLFAEQKTTVRAEVLNDVGGMKSVVGTYDIEFDSVIQDDTALHQAVVERLQSAGIAV